MPKESHVLYRYWSVVTAIILPVIVFFVEGTVRAFPDYEVVRAVISVLCIALLVHSWFMQRRFVQSRWRLAFFTLLLWLPALGALWLGLNVIRSYTYDSAADYRLYSTVWYQGLYWKVVELQNTIVLLAKVLGIAAALWTIVDLARWLARRIQA